jgi:hypothetical protein
VNHRHKVENFLEPLFLVNQGTLGYSVLGLIIGANKALHKCLATICYLEPMDFPTSTRGWPGFLETAFSISAMWLTTSFSAFGGAPFFPFAQSAEQFDFSF